MNMGATTTTTVGGGGSNGGEGAAVIGAIDGIKTFGCNRGGVIGLRTLDSAVDLNHNSISKML